MSGSVSGWQVFILVYFLTLSIALIAAFAYRRWLEREALGRFEDLMRRRSSLYEMLKILTRESRDLSARSDEDLAEWLTKGTNSWPEGQALRDVDTELDILQGELKTLRAPKSLAAVEEQLARGLDSAREWIAKVLTASSVGQVRAALATTADEQTRRELAEANGRIHRFARKHGIKE